MRNHPGAATEEQAVVYHNQTAILTWLASRGHAVRYNGDPAVPSIHLAPRYSFIGEPCPYCNEKMTKRGKRGVTRDHKNPRTNGGVLTAENRLIVCAGCNHNKGSKTLDEWYEQLFRRGDRRASYVGAILMTAPPVLPEGFS